MASPESIFCIFAFFKKNLLYFLGHLLLLFMACPESIFFNFCIFWRKYNFFIFFRIFAAALHGIAYPAFESPWKSKSTTGGNKARVWVSDEIIVARDYPNNTPANFHSNECTSYSLRVDRRGLTNMGQLLSSHHQVRKKFASTWLKIRNWMDRLADGGLG